VAEQTLHHLELQLGEIGVSIARHQLPIVVIQQLLITLYAQFGTDQPRPPASTDAQPKSMIDR
jgi:hypothetical protein